MESLIPIIVDLLAGAAGGNIAGKLLKNFSLGTLGNSIAGIIGGGIGGQILSALGVLTSGGGGLDVGSLLGNVVGSGVGGGVLMAVVGFIKNMMAKK